MQERQTVLEAQGLGFEYAAEPVLREVHFTVHAGDFVALIGANGAGKSTLLRLVLGELVPARGSIRLFGQAAHRFHQWTRIGYVPQNGAVRAQGFPATVEELVVAGLYAQIGRFRLPGRRHRHRAHEALALVGMQDYAKRTLGELSGGQLQRVMLARVLVAGCELMLLDEPTTGVDGASSEALFTLLAQLNRDNGLTVLLVTHDVVRVAPYAKRVLCLEEGSLLELSPEQLQHELYHRHKHP